MSLSDSDNHRERHLVLLDIGNSRIALAGWSEGGADVASAAAGQRGPVQHLPCEPTAPIVDSVQRIWDELPENAIRAIVVSSVQPQVLGRLENAFEERHLDPLLVIGRELEAPMPTDVEEPGKLGTDRICAAAGAFDKFKTACVVADFGTALTVDLVSDNGVFLGGTIVPGIALSARALHEHTALLPLVEVITSRCMRPEGGDSPATKPGAAELCAPTEILGRNTESAIRNGIFAMMMGALREITEQYATQIGKWPPLVVTGGDGPAVASRCDFVDRVVPDLTLDGVLLAYLRHIHADNTA